MRGGRGDIVEFALVAGLIFFLLFGGFSLMQLIQTRAAIEAAAREAARYVAANVTYSGGGFTLPSSVVNEAKTRAIDVVRNSVGVQLLADPDAGPDPYAVNVQVNISTLLPDRVKAEVICNIKQVVAVGPGSKPEQALKPPVAVRVKETCTFRVPHVITPSDPTG